MLKKGENVFHIGETIGLSGQKEEIWKISHIFDKLTVGQILSHYPVLMEGK